MQNSEKRKAATGWDARLEAAILCGALFVARRWLLFANAALALLIGLALLAPLLMAADYSGPARVIYAAYRVTCHQQPQRSYFLAGPRLTYTQTEIEAQTGRQPLADYLGGPALGYKLAFCQRDLATYAAMLLFGLLYRPLSKRLARAARPPAKASTPVSVASGLDASSPIGAVSGVEASAGLSRVAQPPAKAATPVITSGGVEASAGLPRLSLPTYLLLLVPLAVDGLTQAAGLRESTWLLRTLTGGLFGFATAWLLFPELDVALRRAAADLAARLRGS